MRLPLVANTPDSPQCRPPFSSRHRKVNTESCYASHVSSSAVPRSVKSWPACPPWLRRSLLPLRRRRHVFSTSLPPISWITPSPAPKPGMTADVRSNSTVRGAAGRSKGSPWTSRTRPTTASRCSRRPKGSRATLLDMRGKVVHHGNCRSARPGPMRPMSRIRSPTNRFIGSAAICFPTATCSPSITPTAIRPTAMVWSSWTRTPSSCGPMGTTSITMSTWTRTARSTR